jgi:hypothetical protein
MDLLERFPGAWCDTCRKVQPVILDVMEADERNDHEAADIICDECKSILVTALHMMQKLPAPAARPHPTVDRPPSRASKRTQRQAFYLRVITSRTYPATGLLSPLPRSRYWQFRPDVRAIRNVPIALG